MKLRAVKGSVKVHQLIGLGLVIGISKACLIDGGTGRWRFHLKLRKNTNL